MKRYIPENVEEIKDSKLGYTMYKYSKENKPFILLSYRGKSTKPAFHYNFKTEEARQEAIDNEIQRCTVLAKEKEAARLEKQKEKEEFIKTLEIGQIFYSSWGYEQTNIEFFQIVEKKGFQITFKELNQEIVRAGNMEGEKIGLKDDFADEKEYKKRIGSRHIKLDDIRYLYKWDGKPKQYSSYY